MRRVSLKGTIYFAQTTTELNLVQINLARMIFLRNLARHLPVSDSLVDCKSESPGKVLIHVQISARRRDTGILAYRAGPVIM